MSSQDITLIQRWNESKDPAAFAEIVHRYAGLVYGSCLRVMRNADDAEDVAQECFMKIAEAPVHITTSLGGWLHSMATHRAINRLRLDKRRSARENKYAATQSETGEAVWDDVQHFIDEAIVDLPDDLRNPVIEHFLMGRTMESIGEEIDISKQAVSQRIQKGVEKIRTKLRDKGVPVASVILSAGFIEMAKAEPSQGLQKGLINSGIGGVDADTLAQVAAKKTTAPAFSPLSYSVIAALIAIGAVGIWLARGSSPAVPPSSVVTAILPAGDSINGGIDSGPMVIAQATITADGSEVPKSDVEKAPDFTEFSLNRSLPKPGVGTFMLHVDSPLAVGAVVTLIYVNWKSWEKIPPQRLEFSTTVSENRVAIFRNLPLGKYHFDARNGNSGQNNQFSLTEGLTGLQAPMVALIPRSDVEFDLENEEGERIAGSRAYVYQHQILGTPLQYEITKVLPTEFLDNGNIAIPDIIMGAIKVYIEAPGYAPIITDWIRSRAEPVRVVMREGGSFTCRVVREFGEPVEGVIVHLQGPYFGDHKYAYTDGEGIARLEHLRPLEYSVRVYSQELVMSNESPTVSIAEGEEVEMGEIKLIPGMDIYGRVYELDTGEGISGVRLTVDADIGVAVEDLITDEDGTYTIPNASFVRYTIRRQSSLKYGMGAGKRAADLTVTRDGVLGETEFALSSGIPVSGRVVDTDGRPIGGVMLRAGSTLDSLKRVATSDRRGRFRLNTINAPGPIYIRAQVAMYGRITSGPFEVPAEGLDNIVVKLPHAAMVTGSIRIDGKFAPRKTFLWSEPVDPTSEEARRGTGRTYTYTVARRGKYLLTWLSPGSYNLSVQPPGGSTGPPVATVTVREGQMIENFDINYEITGYVLAGTVVDRQGEPVGAAQLSVINDNGINLRAESDGVGAFSISGLGDGYYTVSVTHSNHSRIQVEGVKAPNLGLRLEMPDHGSVKGHVRSAVTGAPLKRFRIAHYSGLMNEVPPRFSDAKIFGSETGEFALTNIDIGDTTLVVISQDHAPALVHIPNVLEGDNGVYIEVSLQAAAVLEGTVTDVNGMPIQGASIHVPTNSYSYTGGELSLGRTDADGRFKIDVLLEGERNLAVSHPAFVSGNFVVNLAQGERTDVALVLYSGAALAGTVYVSDVPLEGAAIFLQNADGGGRRNKFTRTNAKGEYRFEKIPAGDYLISVNIQDDDGRWIPSEPFPMAFGNNGTQLLDWTY